MKRSYSDATGKHIPERLSEYFDFTTWPDKANRPVTRHELSAVLVAIEKQRAPRRFWRWLTASFRKQHPLPGGPTPTPDAKPEGAK